MLTCVASILELQGNATLSPRPSISRRASRVTNPPASPVSSVATDQIAKPAATTRSTRNRSASQPAGIWLIAYVQ